MPFNFYKFNISCYFYNNFNYELLCILTIWIISIVIAIIKAIKKPTTNFLLLKRIIYNLFVWNLAYLVLFRFLFNLIIFALIEITFIPIDSAFGKGNFMISILLLMILIFFFIHIIVIIKLFQEYNNEENSIQVRTNTLAKFTPEKLANYLTLVYETLARLYKSELVT